MRHVLILSPIGGTIVVTLFIYNLISVHIRWTFHFFTFLFIDSMRMNGIPRVSCTSIHENCSKHHGNNKDLGVIAEICDAVGERTKVILI